MKDRHQKVIHYFLPVDIEIWSMPDNTLKITNKGYRLIYNVPVEKKALLEKIASEKHISFEEALLQKFQQQYNDDPMKKIYLLQMREYIPKPEIRFKLTAPIREAYEGETEYIPERKIPRKPYRLKLKHVLIITSVLSIVAVLAVLFFSH